MTPEREAEIKALVTGKASIIGTYDDAVREQAAQDPKVAAAAEKAEFFASLTGKRQRGIEKQRTEREIDDEHTAAHLAALTTAVGWLDYSLSEEEPILQSCERDCQQPDSVAEAYERAVPDRGGPDRPLHLALAEEFIRGSLRRELAGLLPSAVLAMYRDAVSGSAVSPDAVVRRAVLVQEVERRGDNWPYDVKGEGAADEHAAVRELVRLTASTKASRVPPELREALDRAREARRFADRLREVHKLRPVPPSELFGETGVDERYKAHPRVQQALQRRKDGR